MIIRDRSFPHPVLAPFRDDIAPNNFVFDLAVSPDADAYYLKAKFVHDNPTLSDLIAQGRASYVLHLECRQNFFRKTYRSNEVELNVTIPSTELLGKVEASAFINAEMEIANYKIVGAHPDYGDSTFHIRQGDVLAAAESLVFQAYVDYDPLKKLSSILNIWRSESLEEGPMTVDLSIDTIIATLSQRDYERYTKLKADPALAPVLSNQVVIPALLVALAEMKACADDDWDDQLSKRWFRSIDKKLSETNLNIRSESTTVLDALQLILKWPLRRSLAGLEQLAPLEDDA